MRHTFLNVLLIILLILFSSGSTRGVEEDQFPDGELDAGMTILDVLDPLGDDYGPGTYLYPTNSQFAPYQGLLDIERFKVISSEEEICFQITFGKITNPWKAPFGFSHQLIQIYIDHRPGGKRHTFYPGARVVFSPRASWDTFIKVTGWGIYLFDCTDLPVKEPEPYTSGEVQVLADQKTIQVKLPFQQWSNRHDLLTGSYYLLVGGQDGFGPDNFRVVQPGVNEWYFGGGDDTGYAPNVIDIVVPPGKDQQTILGSYDPTNRLRAVVEPVTRPNPIRRGVIYLISLIICGLIWYGWRKRDVISRNQ